MIGKLLKSITQEEAKSFAKMAANTAISSSIEMSKFALEKATDSIEAANEFVADYTTGKKISIGGIEFEIDSRSAASMLYNAIVPKTAQAILGGRMPTAEDYTNDAVAFIGGPIEGIYVAANSESARLISENQMPSAEQLGRDMIAALTPVALARLGL